MRVDGHAARQPELGKPPLDRALIRVLEVTTSDRLAKCHWTAAAVARHPRSALDRSRTPWYS